MFELAAHELRKLSRLNGAKRVQRLKDARLKGTHTRAEWGALLSQFEGRCVKCGVVPVETIQKDHITPIHLGGDDSILNLQPLCRSCNCSKPSDSFDWKAYRMEHGFE